MFNKTYLLTALVAFSMTASAINIKTQISIKQPGNPAAVIQLQSQGSVLKAADGRALPLQISEQCVNDGDDQVYTITIKADATTYYNIGAALATGIKSADSEFYLPGFWYHRNLRSPKGAPAFHTSKSWNFREDRLSSPMTSVFDMANGKSVAIMRCIDRPQECLTTHQQGEIILSGETSLGYLGLDCDEQEAKLTFGYPYIETPKRYIRKLTLAAPVFAFAKIEKGETKTLKWRISQSEAKDFGQHVTMMWQRCFDCLNPQPLKARFTPEEMKKGLTNYFRQSYVGNFPLKYHSGHTLLTSDCKPYPEAQIGFVGRVLLNAFNAIEYGEQHGEQDLVTTGQEILESYLQHGLTSAGYFYDNVNFERGFPLDEKVVHSIRQQSEGVYAILLYLKYEKAHGRKHPEWEAKIKGILDGFLKLQKADGSFARKYKDDGSDVDGTGGSTPSSTSALVMGYRYFGKKQYLEAARRTVNYLEQNIISKSDYFSSTLDANCEDKEAAIAAVTATYYLAAVTKGKERQHYIDLCEKAAYFALSWYYMWDVPFAQGQMLGDLGLKTRGWSNVSVENNHIDVFVFELPHIVKWLGEQKGNSRFLQMHDVIFNSLSQLMPTTERLCGIALPGFYPEVVQHTTWDYGMNGKGFYNNLFAPGWTVASLWEMYSPTRTDDFLKK
ncbi:MAG: hypothetical protein E7101_11525 [Prevotella ruminicola]|uniref:Uncharacterized protein n=1 Tax=Xylanibacter ruminicola TaxID=839 RepID=A0A9D5SA62_XYLRU|nr:hypothetical protein [Xylanibacter ruminicola]